MGPVPRDFSRNYEALTTGTPSGLQAGYSYSDSATQNLVIRYLARPMLLFSRCSYSAFEVVGDVSANRPGTTYRMRCAR